MLHIKTDKKFKTTFSNWFGINYLFSPKLKERTNPIFFPFNEKTRHFLCQNYKTKFLLSSNYWIIKDIVSSRQNFQEGKWPDNCQPPGKSYRWAGVWWEDWIAEAKVSYQGQIFLFNSGFLYLYISVCFLRYCNSPSGTSFMWLKTNKKHCMYGFG